MVQEKKKRKSRAKLRIVDMKGMINELRRTVVLSNFFLEEKMLQVNRAFCYYKESVSAMINLIRGDFVDPRHVVKLFDYYMECKLFNGEYYEEEGYLNRWVRENEMQIHDEMRFFDEGNQSRIFYTTIEFYTLGKETGKIYGPFSNEVDSTTSTSESMGIMLRKLASREVLDVLSGGKKEELEICGFVLIGYRPDINRRYYINVY